MGNEAEMLYQEDDVMYTQEGNTWNVKAFILKVCTRTPNLRHFFEDLKKGNFTSLLTTNVHHIFLFFLFFFFLVLSDNYFSIFLSDSIYFH